jgi:hypothetical protein
MTSSQSSKFSPVKSLYQEIFCIFFVLKVSTILGYNKHKGAKYASSIKTTFINLVGEPFLCCHIFAFLGVN